VKAATQAGSPASIKVKPHFFNLLRKRNTFRTFIRQIQISFNLIEPTLVSVSLKIIFNLLVICKQGSRK